MTEQFNNILVDANPIIPNNPNSSLAKGLKIEEDNINLKIDVNIVKTKKLTALKWSLIEKPLSESDKQRNQIICDLGEKLSNETFIKNKSNLITIGEYNYLRVRESLLKLKLIKLPDYKSVDNKKKEKISKKVQMILDNSSKTINNKADTLISILKNAPQEKMYEDLMVNFNYIELRIFILMKIIESYTESKMTSFIKNKLKSQSQAGLGSCPDIPIKDAPEKEEVLIASKKILHTLKKIRTDPTEYSDYFNKIFSISDIKIELCEQLIIDLEFKINNLMSESGFKLYDIANRRPKLIFDTKYDITIPQMKLKPYETQVDLINCVKDNIKNGFMILYKTLPGLGKTTMILGICKFIKKMSDENIKVIFCCSDILESVRVQVLRTMYNFGIKFGIGSAFENTYKIINSWNCPKDEDRELIVSDYTSTYSILKEGKHPYLLFFDEPTVHTDNKNHTTTLEYLAKILYYAPKYTILSSATLPLKNEIENIIQNYKSRHPEGIVKEIVSNKTLTGCIIKDFNNNVITPHKNCKNVNELKELIIKIKSFPLLGKFYTLPFLMNLNEFMKGLGNNKNIDLDSIESFDQESILENIIILLERVCELEKQEDFDEFNSITIRDIVEDNFDKSRLDVKYDEVVPEKLLTSHAYKYLGCCLIATDSPLEYCVKNMYPIVAKLKEKVKLINIDNDYDKYKKDLKCFDEQIEAINLKYKQETVIDEEIEKIMHKKPKFRFPQILEINTHEHIEIFSKYVKSYDKTMLKSCINYEQIDITKFNVDEELKFLLFMGVGVYSKNLDSDYCNTVLEMLSDRQLAYIIADESFCYGANYQISNVIINDDIGDSHSINTILQLIGRTSRVGKSWSGKVYLDKNTCARILEFFMDPSNISNEGANISDSFDNIIGVINKDIIIQTEKEEAKRKELEIIEGKKLAEKTRIEEEKRLEKEKQQMAKINEKDDWKSARRQRVIVDINAETNSNTNTNTNTNTNESDDGTYNYAWANRGDRADRADRADRNDWVDRNERNERNDNNTQNLQNTSVKPEKASKSEVIDDSWIGIRSKRVVPTDNVYMPGRLRKTCDNSNEQTESKKVESKQVESKQVESKQVESKQTESKQTESKQAESKQTESKQAESKFDEESLFKPYKSGRIRVNNNVSVDKSSVTKQLVSKQPVNKQPDSKQPVSKKPIIKQSVIKQSDGNNHTFREQKEDEMFQFLYK